MAVSVDSTCERTPTTFDEFCAQWQVTEEERRKLWCHLTTMRLELMLRLYREHTTHPTA